MADFPKSEPEHELSTQVAPFQTLKSLLKHAPSPSYISDPGDNKIYFAGNRPQEMPGPVIQKRVHKSFTKNKQKPTNIMTNVYFDLVKILLLFKSEWQMSSLLKFVGYEII
jgi:hypothetical protein